MNYLNVIKCIIIIIIYYFKKHKLNNAHLIKIWVYGKGP